MSAKLTIWRFKSPTTLNFFWQLETEQQYGFSPEIERKFRYKLKVFNSNFNLTRVNSLVIEKVRTSTEAFITVWAFVITLACVNSPVNHQTVFPRKGFGALEKVDELIRNSMNSSLKLTNSQTWSFLLECILVSWYLRSPHCLKDLERKIIVKFHWSLRLENVHLLSTTRKLAFVRAIVSVQSLVNF